jgi:hypothetical protein
MFRSFAAFGAHVHRERRENWIPAPLRLDATQVTQVDATKQPQQYQDNDRETDDPAQSLHTV